MPTQMQIAFASSHTLGLIIALVKADLNGCVKIHSLKYFSRHQPTDKPWHLIRLVGSQRGNLVKGKLIKAFFFFKNMSESVYYELQGKGSTLSTSE